MFIIILWVDPKYINILCTYSYLCVNTSVYGIEKRIPICLCETEFLENWSAITLGQLLTTNCPKTSQNDLYCRPHILFMVDQKIRIFKNKLKSY